ncbi:50S ribosomal protein L25 [bacterium]|nr:50S ribosomal protein L25 [bacterium]MBU1153126.1 50S ribosomal protein L25 [bacterium]MBU2599211.1 50S ribosomal protein L25 [bacterium]
MKTVSLGATIRKGTKKGYSRRLRQRGFIPAVLYGHKEEPLLLELDNKSLKKALFTEAGDNIIINLEIKEGEKFFSRTTILKEKQTHFITRDITHIDFQHISLDEKVEFSIPIHIVGEPKGVKEGGILEQNLWEIEVESLPSQVLESINVDISNLGINESIYVKDIKLTEEVKILSDLELLIATVRPMVEIKEEVTTTEKTKAPEVIKEKREKESESEEK